MKHTAAPWIAATGYQEYFKDEVLAVVEPESHRVICVVSTKTGLEEGDVENAQLLARSPELLALSTELLPLASEELKSKHEELISWIENDHDPV